MDKKILESIGDNAAIVEGTIKTIKKNSRTGGFDIVLDIVGKDSSEVAKLLDSRFDKAIMAVIMESPNHDSPYSGY